MNIELVQEVVDMLPFKQREFLAGGPTNAEHGCNVCAALYPLEDSEAADWLGTFHVDVPEDGVGVYLRCIYIYLCAGWEGS